MNNVNAYVNSLRDDFYNIFVLNNSIDHRVGAVKEQEEVKTSLFFDNKSEELVFDYDSDYVDDNDNLLTPWV